MVNDYGRRYGNQGVSTGKRLDNSEGRAGKHKRHDLMVYECNESLRFEWNGRHLSLYVFQQRPATESLAAFDV
jgi:hypothetical protein